MNNNDDDGYGNNMNIFFLLRASLKALKLKVLYINQQDLL